MKINAKKILNECGRSLIEMLAVVAIIGVITVLGLISYQYTLNRHRANALKGEVASMALNTSIKLQAQSEFEIQGNLEYPFAGSFDASDRTFTITVSEIPRGVCSAIQADPLALAYNTAINDNGICQRENAIAFSFHNSLFDGAHPELSPSGVSSAEPQARDLCHPCQEGCVETCKVGSGDDWKYWCWSDGCACRNGMINAPYCDQKQPCSQDLINIGDCDGNVIRTCCPDYEICEQPDCGETSTCKSDIVVVHNCNHTTINCCPDNETCADEENCCDVDADCSGSGNICVNYHCACETGYTKGADGNCGVCPTTTVFRATSESECNNCNSATHPYEMKHGLCEPAPTCTKDSECTYMYGFCINGICGCPEKGYFRNENGNCTKCDDIKAKEKSTFIEECRQCNNRYMYKGKCKICEGDNFIDVTGTACNSCPTKGEMFKPRDESDCAKCSTEEHPYQMIGGICKPQIACKIDADCGQWRFCIDGVCGCPVEGYFQNKNGNCTKCDDAAAKARETFDDECAKCNGLREMINGQCTLK